MPAFYLGRTNPKASDTPHATQTIVGAQGFTVFKQTIDNCVPPKRPKKGAAAGSWHRVVYLVQR